MSSTSTSDGVKSLTITFSSHDLNTAQVLVKTGRHCVAQLPEEVAASV